MSADGDHAGTGNDNGDDYVNDDNHDVCRDDDVVQCLLYNQCSI